MKLQNVILAVLISFSSISGCSAQSDYSVIKGKVFSWPSDTVFLQTMPFHSPFSSGLVFQVLDEDSTFSFQLESTDLPLVVQLYSKKEYAELNKEELLLLNYTDDYYYGHCVKFYTYGASTFLLEPGKSLDVRITANLLREKLSPEMAEQYKNAGGNLLDDNTIEYHGETGLVFSGENCTQYEYFQGIFDLQDKVDNRLELYQNKPFEKMDKAIDSYNKIRAKLLDNLEGEKDNLSDTYYEYVKAEIEFGARVEFLKFLMFTNKKETEVLDSFFSKEISQNIIDIIEFDKNKITPAVMASEAYNKYREIYINFKLNMQNKKFSPYYEFNAQKCKTAIQELPEETVYYYLAGQLLSALRTEDWVEDLLVEIIVEFPEGELNERLMEKYDL